MNKGFYSIIISSIALIVLVIVGLQALSYESIKTKNSIYLVLAAQTRNALEDMHYAFDKSVTNAIKSNFDQENCSVLEPTRSITSNFNEIKDTINSTFEVDCSYNSNVSQSQNSVNVTVTLKCSNTLSKNGTTIFFIEFKKENVNITKNYLVNGEPPNCFLTVTDGQGEYQEWP